MVCHGYKLSANLDLKQSRDLAATISWDRLFHSELLSIINNNNEQIVSTTYVFHNSVAANADHNSLAGNVNTAMHASLEIVLLN